MTDPLLQILDRYGELCWEWRWALAGLFAVGACAGAIGPRPLPRRTAAILRAVVLVLLCAAAVTLALRRISLFDDAYISFRYARNLVEGHGLVFNLGERVEGYTNFLWTVLIALLMWLTGIEAPRLALWLCLLALVGNLLVVARLGAALGPRDGRLPIFPLAAALLAVSQLFTSYGTTGMETMAASLLVNLGAYFLVARDDARGAGLAGFFLILATFTRPDHGLFFVVGGAVLLAEVFPDLLGAPDRRVRGLWQAGGARLVAFAAPFLAYGGYLVWKLHYYGSILPNTFYAKSAALPYYRQGVVYAATFLAGTHLWVATILFLTWMLVRPRSVPERRFKRFAAGSVLLYGLYVIRLGGDFMYGRFFVVLMPLLLLGAERLLRTLTDPVAARTSIRRAAAAMIAGLLFATAHGVALIRPGIGEWGVADQTTWRRIPLSCVQPGGEIPALGASWRRLLVDRGLMPRVAAGGIGEFGYFSGLPIADMWGLVDPALAREPVERRAVPGHERVASVNHLISQGAKLTIEREHIPDHFRDLTRIEVPDIYLSILVYDRDLMRAIRERAPEVRFTDFEEYLDRYIAGLPGKNPASVAKDLAWFRQYYFDHNDDPGRLKALEDFLAARGTATSPRP